MFNNTWVLSFPVKILLILLTYSLYNSWSLANFGVSICLCIVFMNTTLCSLLYIFDNANYYCSNVGKLLHPTYTRLGTASVISTYMRFTTAPPQTHLNATNYIFYYSKNNMAFAIPCPKGERIAPHPTIIMNS